MMAQPQPQVDEGAAGLQLRDVQEMRRASELYYYQQITGLERLPAVMQPPIAAGKCGREEVLQTNAFGIGLTDVPVYRYDLTAYGLLRGRPPTDDRPALEDRLIEITKLGPDDVCKVFRQRQCRRLLPMLLEKFPYMFGEVLEHFFYDSQRILYSKKILDVAAAQSKEFVFEESDLAADGELFRGFHNVTVLIGRVSSGFQISCADLNSYITGDMDKLDHSLQQFLEILTAQYALNNPDEAICYGSNTAYLMKPEVFGFKAQDMPTLDEGKYLAVGASKSVRFIEGPRGRGSQKAALVIDIKKSAFHSAHTVYQKVEHLIKNRDLTRLRQQLRGLGIETMHTGQKREYRIDNVVEETAKTKKFMNKQGTIVTLVEYFQQAWQIHLKFPDAPLVVAKGRRENFLPMELCFVADNQRVTSSQQTPAQIQKQIRASAVPPADRVRQIGYLVRGLMLNSANIYHREASVTITNNPLQIRARVLAHPQIQYGSNSPVVLPDAKATWRFTGRNKPPFIFPATIGRWALFGFSAGRDSFNPQLLTQFASQFVQECSSRGMKMGECVRMSMLPPSAERLQETFIEMKELKCDFIFFITSNELTNLHHPMKLLEREIGIITQDLKSSSAYDIINKGKRQTLENIVLKTNMKNGGLNYTVRLPTINGKNVLSKGRLVIGMATSHYQPSEQSNSETYDPSVNAVPSVIGIAANVKEDPMDFIGDCLFQAARRNEKIGVMQPLMLSVLESYCETHGTLPTEIIVFRDGASEGQYKDILDIEVMLLRSAVKSFAAQEPKLTFIVTQKMHNLRLMPVNITGIKAADQNVKPGTVVDTQVVHPCYTEFYLNSHVALQGTARVPRYTVLVDDQHMTMDELQTLTHGLTFAHQIVNLTTSLPSPVYIASAYAERGRNLFTEAEKKPRVPTAPEPEPERPPPAAQVSSEEGSSPNSSNAQSASTNEGMLDYNRLAHEFSYANSRFRKTRVNA